MDVSAIQDINLIREAGALAFVVGALAFLAWEAYAKRQGADWGPGSTKQAGHAGAATV